MKKNKNILLILIVLLIVIYVLVSFIPSLFKGKGYRHTVFIGSTTKVEINGSNIKVYNKNEEIKKQKVKAYFNDKFIEAYIASEEGDTFGTVYNLYDKEDNVLFTETALLASTNDISLKVKNGSSNEITDLTEVYKFVQGQKIILSQDIMTDYIEVTNIDIDNDGEEEYIYSVGLIKDAEEYDSFVFMKDNNKYILIDREESEYDEVSNIRLKFFNLIDFNNDGEYEFVVEKIMSEYGPYHYEIYNFNNDSFGKIEEE